MKITFAICISLLALSITVFAQDPIFDRLFNSDTTGNGIMEQHAAAKSNMQKSYSISVQQFKQMMKNDPSLVVLDVRNPDELKGPLGKINNSINIPLKDLDSRIGELDQFKDKTIAVICKIGVRSKKAQSILTEHGFKSKNVEGGMEAYRKTEKRQ